MDDLIDKLVDKKELRGLSKDFILSIIDEFKVRNSSVFIALEKNNFNPKSKEFSLLKKYVRKRLRELHGVFYKNKLSEKKQDAFIDVADFDFYSPVVQKFLKSHRSTKERLPYFESVYARIEKTRSVVSLVDLGCGLNPLSYSLLKDLKRCFCADINVEEINFLNQFFDKASFDGEAMVLDLTVDSALSIVSEKTKGVDCTFLFKVLDGLESMKRGSSAKLLACINSDLIIISFSNITISGKNNIKSQRFWFRNLLDDLKLKGFTVDEFSFGFEDYFLLYK
jgi:hypothetical protein